MDNDLYQGSVGLILEGGGMRGVYTAGVLRFFMDRGLYFPYVIGVSMGACNGANYVSGQGERNRIVNIHYVNDARFISYRRLLLKGELFGTQFIFDTLPNQLVPFDFDTFMKSPQRYFLTTTDCMTGEAVYYEKEEMGEASMTLFQAGCSLPLIQKPVHYDGRVLMDGGIADSIPVEKSMDDGNVKHILVLTQPKGYRKKPSRMTRLVSVRYRKYPGLGRALEKRHRRYNDTVEHIDRLEKDGKVFIIRPDGPLDIGRIERNKERLYTVYDQGYAEAEACFSDMNGYLNR